MSGSFKVFISSSISLSLQLESEIEDEINTLNNCHNYYTQTILLAQFTVKLLQQTNSATDLIEKYIDFLLQYSDNVTYFNTELSPRIS